MQAPPTCGADAPRFGIARVAAQVTQALSDTGTDLTGSALSKRSRARSHLAGSKRAS